MPNELQENELQKNELQEKAKKFLESYDDDELSSINEQLKSPGAHTKIFERTAPEGDVLYYLAVAFYHYTQQCKKINSARVQMLSTIFTLAITSVQHDQLKKSLESAGDHCNPSPNTLHFIICGLYEANLMDSNRLMLTQPDIAAFTHIFMTLHQLSATHQKTDANTECEFSSAWTAQYENSNNHQKSRSPIDQLCFIIFKLHLITSNAQQTEALQFLFGVITTLYCNISKYILSAHTNPIRTLSRNNMIIATLNFLTNAPNHCPALQSQMLRFLLTSLNTQASDSSLCDIFNHSGYKNSSRTLEKIFTKKMQDALCNAVIQESKMFIDPKAEHAFLLKATKPDTLIGKVMDISLGDDHSQARANISRLLEEKLRYAANLAKLESKRTEWEDIQLTGSINSESKELEERLPSPLNPC